MAARVDLGHISMPPLDSLTSTTLVWCTIVVYCLGGAVVGCRSRDRKVAGSTPGRGAIKSTRSTQPSIAPVNRVPACMHGWGLAGAFTCVRWQVTRCDPVALRWGSKEELYWPLYLYVSYKLELQLIQFTPDPSCSCGAAKQTMSHSVNDCPLSRFPGGLTTLHLAGNQVWLGMQCKR